MGIWEWDLTMYCKVCKTKTDHKGYNYNDDEGDVYACLECECK